MAKITFGQLKGVQPAPTDAGAPKQTEPVNPAPAVKPFTFKKARLPETAPQEVQAAQAIPPAQATPPAQVAPPAQNVTPPATRSFQRARSVEALAEEADAKAVAETPAAPVEVVGSGSPNTALVPRKGMPVARGSTFGGIFEDVENIDFRDLQLPRVNLVQKSGDLADSFDSGDLVFMKEIVLPVSCEFHTSRVPEDFFR